MAAERGPGRSIRPGPSASGLRPPASRISGIGAADLQRYAKADRWQLSRHGPPHKTRSSLRDHAGIRPEPSAHPERTPFQYRSTPCRGGRRQQRRQREMRRWRNQLHQYESSTIGTNTSSRRRMIFPGTPCLSTIRLNGCRDCPQCRVDGYDLVRNYYPRQRRNKFALPEFLLRTPRASNGDPQYALALRNWSPQVPLTPRPGRRLEVDEERLSLAQLAASGRQPNIASPRRLDHGTGSPRASMPEFLRHARGDPPKPRHAFLRPSKPLLPYRDAICAARCNLGGWRNPNHFASCSNFEQSLLKMVTRRKRWSTSAGSG